MKNMSILTLVRILLLACFSIGIAYGCSEASANESQCTVRVPKDLFNEFFSQMHSNLAFRNGEVVGFRIYEKKSNPGAMAELGLLADDLVTHFCGIRLNDALSADSAICCIAKEPTRNRVELTVERDRKVIRVMAPMPSKRVQATRKTRAPDA
jgi:hypothetical protein